MRVEINDAGEVLIDVGELSPDAYADLRPCTKETRATTLVFDFGSPCFATRAKRWGIRAPSRGLGDTIARIAGAVGISPCSKCKNRQAKLNRIVPYK